MMESYKTQKDMVLEYMLKHGSITTSECFEQLGITRLSAAIHLLKKDGLKIVKTGITKKKPDGRTLYYEIFRVDKESV